MKFCPRKVYSYVGYNSLETSTFYITQEDVKEFHGEEFFKTWYNFIKDKHKVRVNDKECYYYADYEFAARQTNSFLYPVS